MLTRRALLIGGGAAGLTILTRRSALADPALIGSWGPRRRLPHIAIHSAHLPGTQTLLQIAQVGVSPNPGTLAWVLDYVTGRVTLCPIPFAYDAMCGGGVVDDRGQVRMYGGGPTAPQKSALFDPATRAWRPGPFMSQRKGAYYASAVRTGPIEYYPGGAIVVAFGRRAWIDVYDQHDYGRTELARMPASVNRADLAGSSQVYPRLMVLPDGRLFLAGMQRTMAILDVAEAEWIPVAEMLWARRYEGTATSVGPSGYEFFLSGSIETGVPSQKHNEVVDVRTGAVREVHPPLVIRGQANTQVLPDGTVLVVGGRNGPGLTFAPELYDHARDTITLMAEALPDQGGLDLGRCMRAYHSTCELLDDGRILSAGGVPGTKPLSYEIFSPPYLFRGPRPQAVLTSGDTVAHGGPLTLQTSGPAVTRVTLVRSEHSSHGYNSAQRCYDLAFSRAGSLVIARAPTSPTDAPPGWYRVFSLASGVPSIASWVRVVRDP